MHRTKTPFLLLIIPFATFVANLDNSIVNIVFPTLLKEFDTTLNTVSWVSLSYLLSFVSTLLIFGRIGDIKGPERVFKYGFLWFGLASLFCGIADDIFQLVIFRFIQGVGGAMIMSTYAAVVTRNIVEEKRGSAFGLGGVFAGLGFALGAPIGGVLVQYMTWRWIFFINIPFCIIAYFLCLRYFKHHTGGSAQKMDYKGAVISFIMLTIFVVGLSQLNSSLLSNGVKIVLACLFIISLLLFVWVERDASAPLVDISIFKTRNISIGLLLGILVIILLAGYNFIFPFFFENGRGLSTSVTGLVLMTYPILTLFLAPASGRWCDKGYTIKVISTSTFLFSLAVLLFYFFSITISFALIIGVFVLYGIGISLFMTANTTLVMNNAPVGREGLAGSLNSGFSFLGSIIGIALFENLFSYQLGGVHSVAATAYAFHSVVLYSWIVIIPLMIIPLFLVRKTKT